MIVSFGLFALPKKIKKAKAIFLALFQLGFFAFFISKIPEVKNGKILTTVTNWIPELGLNLNFTLDGLSMVFAVLITGIGALIFFYAHVYMKSYKSTDKFYFYLFLFSGAMLGMVLSGNLIQLFVFWELTSFLSFMLISFFNEKELARKAAFQSLFVTAFGGLILLLGIVLLGSVVDSYHIADWIKHADLIKSSKYFLPGLILILIGAFTKSAQFPFHFWLPGAMQAPTPVSSYLHSATMVKAGFFILLRLHPVLAGTPEWIYIITLVGVITMLIGSYFAITQTDLKSILAYTTISALGILFVLIGIDTKLSIKAAILFLYIHAFYKATLFMIAGIIDKKAGTKELSKLGGLIRQMPISTIISFLALLSMAGLPPMLGFLGKELIYEAKVQAPGISSLILVLGVASNIFMIAVSIFFFRKVFLGKSLRYITKPNEKGWLLFMGPGILVLLSLFLGLFPNILDNLIIEPAVNTIYGEVSGEKLKVWHGFNKVFYLSLFTVLSGVGLFSIIIIKPQVLDVWRAINKKLLTLSFTEVFSKGLDILVHLSKHNSKIVQHGFHRYYILTIIVFTTILLWFQVYVTRQWFNEIEFSLTPFYISGLVVVIVISTTFSAVSKSRIATIIAMGVTGYGISLIYLYYSAIDLAITQIIVETLIVIMFVIILQRLPSFAKLSARRTKIRDLIIALSFGGVMTVLTLKAVRIDLSYPISDYFIEHSATKAFGNNIVNVILVDFRALDTLGEVTVLTIAALGVYVLLKRKKS